MTRMTGFRVYGAAAGGGGGSVTYNQHTIADEYVGPTSYPTGGFVIDLTKTFSTINFFDTPIVKKGSRGTLPAVRYEITRNSPAAGKVTVKIVRKRYDRTSTVGNVSGQPSGVTVATSSGQTVTSESSHTHSIDHDHGSFASATGTPGTGGVVLLGLTAQNNTTHTHTLDLPNLTGTSGAGTSHNHTDDSIYQHQHSLTQTSTVYASSELPNATDLSGTTWYICANGVKV